MDVIGAGFGRTGTLTLKSALERLGFGPCYHMVELLRNPEHLPRWREALASDPLDVERAFAGYRSTVDWPGCGFWRELVAAHPAAKVVLTTRDPHRWYASAKRTIWARERPGHDNADLAVREFGRFMAEELRPRMMRDEEKDGRPLPEMDEGEAVAVFERHIAEVKAEVPADRLLVYQVSEGWGPLCDFLGVPVPEEDFPHVNDSANFAEVARAAFEERARRQAALDAGA